MSCITAQPFGRIGAKRGPRTVGYRRGLGRCLHGGAADGQYLQVSPVRQPTGRCLMAVSRRLRFEILKRDDYACRYCGAKVPDVELTVDHVLPVALGGTDEPTNLVAACRACNGGKSSAPPTGALVADVEKDAWRWAQAMTFASEERRAQQDIVDQAADAVIEAWEVYFRHDPEDHDWRGTVRRFVQSGFDQDDLVRFIHVVGRRRRSVEYPDRWRYFCGCCWREITDRQEMARAVLRGET